MKHTSISRLLLATLLTFSSHAFAITLNDNGQISATEVSRIVQVKSEADISNAIKEASAKHLPIAIMGVQHSQGGQSLAENAIELDMLSFNKILNVDTKKKQVTVQSGITWGEIQKHINQYNLAIKSMQSPNIFSVGGSMSVNAHGDDFRAGAVGNSIVSFNILLANGKKVFVTPNNNPKLWSAVIGGYGLLGVVTDVTLQLTDNVLLMSHYTEVDTNTFTNYFHESVFNHKDATLFYAHMNISPGADFMRNMYVITYDNTHEMPNEIVALVNPDKWNVILTPVFNMSRHGDLGKQLRWKMEKRVFKRIYQDHIVTRNNAMEKPLRFASDHHSKYNADWLQEYFIPLNKLAEFIDLMRPIMTDNNVNLLNVTIRYVPAEKNILLPYAKENCFAVVLYFNQDLSATELDKAKSWTRKLVDAAFSVGGNYYLPYQYFPTEAQFKRGYPGYKQVLTLKKLYDPETLFTNKLFDKYFVVSDTNSM